MRRFLQSTRDLTQSVSTNMPAVGARLETPEFLEEVLAEIEATIQTIHTSYLELPERQIEFATVMDQPIRETVQICIKMAATVREPSGSILLLNCLQKLEV